MFAYQRGASVLLGPGDFLANTIRVLLERSTSTYTPNRDHDFVSDLAGLVEITVASYVRQSLGTKVLTINDAQDRVEGSCANPAFGSLEAGQTVKGAIIYRQVGGDDTTPADDELLFYFDGKIDVTLAADAANGATTIWVEPLIAGLPAGTAVNFGGGATGTLNAGAALGARSLNLTGGALAAAAVAGAISAGLLITGNILPYALGGGPFNLTVDAGGLFQVKPR